jgi:SpoVK/Ycf46/Vps4 family AAA+-type ATPase
LSTLFFTDRSDVAIEDIVFNDAVAAQIHQFLKEYQFRDILLEYGLPVNNKILLHGATGCGKTMTARAIAKHLDRKLIIMNLSSIVSSKLGETAKNVAALFKEASYHDSVLFFDEFDTIGTMRDNDSKDNSEMKRVVNAILQLIDDFPKKSILIAATNRVNMLDEALLRRFELKLEYTAPGNDVLDSYYTRLLAAYPKEFTDIERKYGISFAEAKDYVLTSVKNNIIETQLSKTKSGI